MAWGAGNRGGTQVVMSTFVDFEGWAMDWRLALPPGTTAQWDTASRQASGESHRDLRNTTLAINNMVHDLGIERLGSDSSLGQDWSNVSSGIFDDGSQESEDSSANDFGEVMSMLIRHISGSQVTASSFETEIKSAITNSQADSETVLAWFISARNNAFTTRTDGACPEGENSAPCLAYSAYADELFDDEGEMNQNPEEQTWIVDNPLVSVAGSSAGENQSGQGVRGLTTTLRSTESVLAFGTQTTTAGDNSGCGLRTGNISVWANQEPQNCNLAPMATFNYLNTDFGASALTVYSAGNVMSEATRSVHNSVNLVGTGVMSLIYWANSAVLLLSFVVVGFAYALTMFFSSIKRGIQVITTIPFATLGVTGAIAKMVIYSLALVLEVLGTVFIYLLVQQFLMSLPVIIEAPLSHLLNSDGAGATTGALAFLGISNFLTFLAASAWVGPVIAIISMIAMLAFVVMALRVRKTILKAMDEVVTKLVEKFMDTQATPAAAGPGPMGRLPQGAAAALGAGAGAAGTSRLLGGPKGSGYGNSPGHSGPGTSSRPDNSGPSTGGAGGLIAHNPSGPDNGPDGASGTPAGEDSGDTPGHAGTSVIPAGSSESAPTIPDLDGLDNRSDDTVLARQIESNGLTFNPGPVPQSHDSSQPAQPSQPGDGADGALETAQSAIDEDAQTYAEADKMRAGAALEAGRGAIQTAEAVGRGASGDVAGATKAGGDAAQSLGRAGTVGAHTSAHEERGTASSVDDPKETEKRAQRHESAAAGAQGIQQAGAMASQAGSTAGGSSVSGNLPSADSSSPSENAQAGPTAGQGEQSRSETPQPAGNPSQPSQAPQSTQSASVQVDAQQHSGNTSQSNQSNSGPAIHNENSRTNVQSKGGESKSFEEANIHAQVDRSQNTYSNPTSMDNSAAARSAQKKSGSRKATLAPPAGSSKLSSQKKRAGRQRAAQAEQTRQPQRPASSAQQASQTTPRPSQRPDPSKPVVADGVDVPEAPKR